MERLKKLTVIVLLAVIMCMGASVPALAGTSEAPGTPAGTSEAPGITVTVSGTIEAPGFTETILFMAALIM